MTLFEGIKAFGKYYIFVICHNCGMKNKLGIKKGITIEEFARSNMAVCENCGCIIKFREFQTEWLK